MRLCAVCVCRVADHAKVFVNGNWVGIVPDAEHIAQVIRGKRRQNLIEFEVSVYRDIPNQEVRESSTVPSCMRSRSNSGSSSSSCSVGAVFLRPLYFPLTSPPPPPHTRTHRL